MNNDKDSDSAGGIAGLSKISKSPINFKSPRAPKVMDFRSAPGLAAGIKRIGGRSGISRLGKSPISTESRHGRLRILHKY
jgi:hypothetical protein